MLDIEYIFCTFSTQVSHLPSGPGLHGTGTERLQYSHYPQGLCSKFPQWMPAIADTTEPCKTILSSIHTYLQCLN